LEKQENSIKCVFCGSSDYRKYYYPPNKYNDKIFNYFQCNSCNAAFIHPLPNKDDFDKMYGADDHTYLKKLNKGEKHIFNYNFPIYNHQGYQIEFFDKFAYHSNAKSLLDIGCGSGFYMNYAKLKGMETVGVEYSSEFASLLREKTELPIFSFEEFEEKYKDKTFDLIHAGHILEHLTNPSTIFDFLKRFSHRDTLVIVDGPLENNFCLSRLIIKTGSLIKRNKMNYYSPQHITFTDYNSQLNFFKKSGLVKINYRITEQLHPLPSHFDKKSIKNSILFILGYFSVNLSMLKPKWGNVFHYAGKFRK
jgi:SAM-dependent methyltransferase